MSGSTTELSLSTAVDSDDQADYLTLSLANSLRTVDALFNNVTGHNHGGAHQGGAIAPSAIPGGSITNAMLGADVARANLLTNGGFEVWQRGNGPFSTNQAFTSDNWKVGFGGTSSGSVTNIASTIASPGRSLQFAYTHAAGGTGEIDGPINEQATQLRGKQISFSLYVKSTVIGSVLIKITDSVGQTLSAHNVTTSAERLTVTRTVDPSATYLYVGIVCDVASCTIECNDAMLVVGSQAANYVPMHPADDLARCLRYYEVLGDPAGGDLLLGAIATAGAQIIRGMFPYKAVKPVSPTVTKVGTWGLTNAGGQPTMITGSKNNTAWYLGSTAAGEYFTSNSAATTCFTVESNP